MVNSASTSTPKASPPEVVVNRANKLTRDPLRRALIEALSRSAPVAQEDDDAS